MADSSSASVDKKSPTALDCLEKEELIQRCKNLLQLAQKAKKAKDGIEEEHERLMERYSLLLQELATKEKSWREKMEQVEARSKQLESDRIFNAERLGKSMDSLKQVHLQEIETAKNAHNAELLKLKQQLDSSENEVIRLEIMLKKEQEIRKAQEEGLGNYGRGMGLPSGHPEKLDICQIEREAAEGQEVESSSGQIPGFSPTSTITSPVPLDQLLNSPSELSSAGLRSTSSSRAGVGGGGVQGPERQVAHLAALLAESEAQNSRLEKLTEVLKEEIRTYQRSEERIKHIENLEYVKNVILKFLTLSGAGERGALLPVLKTILKLKPEEVKKLEELVNAQDESKANQEGWGSYLHLWSTAP